MRYNKHINIDYFLKIFLKQHGLEQGYLEFRVLEAWKKIMGPTINHRTESVRFDNGILFVKITSAPLKQELSMAKSQIVNNLNEALKDSAITEVRFV